MDTNYDKMPVDQLFVFDQSLANVGTLHGSAQFDIDGTEFNLSECSPARLLMLDEHTINYSAFVSTLYCIASNDLLMKKILQHKPGKGKNVVCATLFNNVNHNFNELRFPQSYMLRNNGKNSPVSFGAVCSSPALQYLMDLELAFVNMFSTFDEYSSAMLTNSPLDLFIKFTGASRWTMDLHDFPGQSEAFKAIRNIVKQGKMAVAGKGSH